MGKGPTTETRTYTLMTYTLTQRFSHASYGIGHASLYHIAAYVPVPFPMSPFS